MKPYPAIYIAGYFIRLATEERAEITPMKLQKLLYFAQGFHLALNDNIPLIAETIEAWKYGPVIPTIYQTFKYFGNSSITASQYYELTIKGFVDESDDRIDGKSKEFLKSIWDIYKGYSAIQLSNLTHLDDSPWDKALKANGGRVSTPILDEAIGSYFKQKYLN